MPMISLRKIRSLLLGMATALTIAACHVGALAPGSGDSNPVTPEFAAEGLWTGTDAVGLETVTGIVDSNGKAVFIRSDGLEFTGTLGLSGSTVAAGIDGYANYGSTFSDGTTYGVGTLNGTVTASESLNLTLQFNTSGSTAYDSTWNLSFLTLSTSGATLAKISGTYTDTVTGASVSISSDGAISAQSAGSGWTDCVLTGTVTVPDANYDVYDVSFTYASCSGDWATLNGVAFSGLALLNSNNSPNQIIMAAAGDNGSGDYGIVSTLNRT
jgi:hypothetical protein